MKVSFTFAYAMLISNVQTYWCTKSSYGIPARLCGKSGSVASIARADGNIGESLVSLAVQPRVNEAKRLLALCK